MQKIIIGREQEQQILLEIVTTEGADMLAVTGRRRVGKTYLIRTYFENRIHFEMNGILNASLQQQLQNFDIALKGVSSKKIKGNLPALNWIDAFEKLTKHFEAKKSSKKIIVFIDELPWLDTHRSGFLAAFDWFWNSWAA